MDTNGPGWHVGEPQKGPASAKRGMCFFYLCWTVLTVGWAVDNIVHENLEYRIQSIQVIVVDIYYPYIVESLSQAVFLTGLRSQP